MLGQPQSVHNRIDGLPFFETRFDAGQQVLEVGAKPGQIGFLSHPAVASQDLVEVERFEQAQ